MPTEQNFNNHARYDAKFHFFTVPLLLACFVASLLHLRAGHSRADVLLVPLSFGALMVAFIARLYALKVQDRVIRLEERFRMQTLGVSSAGLTSRQFVALRFASDGELPVLTERARAENLSGKQIKQAIMTWRPDEDRV